MRYANPLAQNTLRHSLKPVHVLGIQLYLAHGNGPVEKLVFLRTKAVVGQHFVFHTLVGLEELGNGPTLIHPEDILAQGADTPGAARRAHVLGKSAQAAVFIGND